MLNGHLHVAVPSAWNSLPDYVRDTSFSLSVFRSKLNHLYADYQTLGALEVIPDDNVLCKKYTFTYLLTY